MNKAQHTSSSRRYAEARTGFRFPAYSMMCISCSKRRAIVGDRLCFECKLECAADMRKAGVKHFVAVSE